MFEMSDNRFEISHKENTAQGKVITKVIVDNETGVNYLFVHDDVSGGLTPLLDSDGKPIVTR